MAPPKSSSSSLETSFEVGPRKISLKPRAKVRMLCREGSHLKWLQRSQKARATGNMSGMIKENAALAVERYTVGCLVTRSRRSLHYIKMPKGISYIGYCPCSAPETPHSNIRVSTYIQCTVTQLGLSSYSSIIR